MFRENKAHPWHGISYGEDAPDVVTVFVEIVPRDTVKYEVDKETGYLKIDRPQQYSNVVPANYGFIPRTYCGTGLADLARSQTDIEISGGDRDPRDILVLSEHHIPRGDIILKARPIGGFCLIDSGEADDKIIAVLNGDAVFEKYRETSELPSAIMQRLEHYFLTYKNFPDEPNRCRIDYVYGRDGAHAAIKAAVTDYEILVRDLNEKEKAV